MKRVLVAVGLVAALAVDDGVAERSNDKSPYSPQG